MIKRIVVATDGSEHGQHAVQWAADFAQALTASVTLIHVLPSHQVLTGWYAMYLPEEGEDAILQEATRRAREQMGTPLATAKLNWDVTVVRGAPFEQIDRVAAEAHADLIVVGSRGLHGLGELLRGSTSHSLASHSHIPVVIVPPPDGHRQAAAPPATNGAIPR